MLLSGYIWLVVTAIVKGQVTSKPLRERSYRVCDVVDGWILVYIAAICCRTAASGANSTPMMRAVSAPCRRDAYVIHMPAIAAIPDV